MDGWCGSPTPSMVDRPRKTDRYTGFAAFQTPAGAVVQRLWLDAHGRGWSINTLLPPCDLLDEQLSAYWEYLNVKRPA